MTGDMLLPGFSMKIPSCVVPLFFVVVRSITFASAWSSGRYARIWSTTSFVNSFSVIFFSDINIPFRTTIKKSLWKFVYCRFQETLSYTVSMWTRGYRAFYGERCFAFLHSYCNTPGDNMQPFFLSHKRKIRISFAF